MVWGEASKLAHTTVLEASPYRIAVAVEGMIGMNRIMTNQQFGRLLDDISPVQVQQSSNFSWQPLTKVLNRVQRSGLCLQVP